MDTRSAPARVTRSTLFDVLAFTAVASLVLAIWSCNLFLGVDDAIGSPLECESTKDADQRALSRLECESIRNSALRSQCRAFVH